MKNRRLWLTLLTLLWPIIHVVVFLVRFGRLPTTDGSWLGLEFLPMGFVGAYVVLNLIEKAESAAQKWLVAAGYLLISPVAFTLSLGGGLIIHPVIGATLLGGGALAIGSWAGSVVGGFIGKSGAK